MKTKLLRKVRKRYSIVYYPNGNQSWIREGYKEPCVILYDNDSIVPEREVEIHR